MQTVPIADNEQGVWVKEGNIIPILNFQKGTESLLQAWMDPIEILIYPYRGGTSITYDTAAGQMYFDDGETFDYQDGAYTWLRFIWSGNLSVTKIVPDDVSYAKASGKYINRATIYKMSSCPLYARNLWAQQRTVGNPEVTIPSICNEEEQSVTLYDFFIPIDQGLAYDTPTALFDLVRV